MAAIEDGSLRRGGMGRDRHYSAEKNKNLKLWVGGCENKIKQIELDNSSLPVMASFKKTGEALAECYMVDVISDEEFVLLYDSSFSKNELLLLLSGCNRNLTYSKENCCVKLDI